MYRLGAESTTILHNFGDYDANGVPIDGQQPVGNLVQTTDGTLYGGTVYRVLPDGSSSATLHSFDYSDGYNSISGLTIGTDGNLYGTTRNSNLGSGVVFSVAPGSGTFTRLTDFSGTSLYGPNGPLLGDPTAPGAFYGEAQYDNPFGSGGLYEVTVTGGTGTLTTLHFFLNNNNDGHYPQGALIIDAAAGQSTAPR